MTQASHEGLERHTFSTGAVDALARALGMGAVLLVLLPIPATALGLLPTYYMHARFLIIYGPVACFLEVAYLFYVRDVLARLLFRHFLEPGPELDPYYRPSLTYRVRVLGTAILPLALIGLSLYCLIRYMTRFDRSVELAEQVMLDELPQATRRHFVLSAEPVADSIASASRGTVADSTLANGSPVPREIINRPALRQYVLARAEIEDIPFFGELTALYVGVFLSAIAAVLMTLLKEHAKQIMGVSEEAFISGAGVEPPAG